MKSLTLYIDKWYIIGAICIDGVPRLITPPNREDRFWLYFYEDITNNEIVYGKDNQSHFRDGENHYIGDVFNKITNPFCRFSRYEGKYEELKGIFQASGIFDVLRNAVENDDNIDTYVSFSPDISGDARLVFLEELDNYKFKVVGSAARIGFLTLEHNRRRESLLDEGYYLVLNACNENLHYTLYKKEDNDYKLESENVLSGMGVDLRGRALAETVVDNINSKTHFLSTQDEKESEYLRMGQHVGNWLVKIANAKPFVPITIPNVSFANQPANIFQVSVIKKKLDERTAVIVNDIIRVITDFVRSSGVRNDEVKGLVFIGNTFTNEQFERALKDKFFICNEKNIVRHKDTDLPYIIGVYPMLEGLNENDWKDKARKDLKKKAKQAEFDSEKKKLDDLVAARNWNDARTQLSSMLNLYLDFASDLSKYKKVIEDGERIDKQAEDKRYVSAMEQVHNHESKQEYEKMKEWCEIALHHKPNDTDAKQKLDDAVRLIAEQAANAKQYNQIIQRANASLMNKNWNDALSQSEAALNVRPNSPEALRIREAARKQLDMMESIKDFINRADIFIGQKLYTQALEELEKVKSLDSTYIGIKERESKIQLEQEKIENEVSELSDNLERALTNKKFESAESICNELIDLDPVNSKKWNRKLSDIRNEKDRFAQLQARWNTIQSDIKTAQWDENYLRMIELCNEALSIDPGNKDILELLSNAENKAKEQKVKSYIEKANDLVHTGSYTSAIDLLNKALLIDENNSELTELIAKYSEKLDIIAAKTKEIEDLVKEKENSFDYKSAIELCNRLMSLDKENKDKWQSEHSRLQSLQIEKSDLELNFRRKKADIKQLIRSGNYSSALKQIELVKKKYHDFGINSHDNEFNELIAEANPQKPSSEKPAKSDKANSSVKTVVKTRTVIKESKPSKADENISKKGKTVQQSEPKEPHTQSNSIDNEGLSLLKQKQFIQAKRYFALQKNNDMAAMCTELIKLEKAQKNGTISPSESGLLKELYKKFDIT